MSIYIYNQSNILILVTFLTYVFGKSWVVEMKKVRCVCIYIVGNSAQNLNMNPTKTKNTH